MFPFDDFIMANKIAPILCKLTNPELFIYKWKFASMFFNSNDIKKSQAYEKARNTGP